LKLSPDLNKTSCEPEVVQKSADVNKAEKIALRPRQEISENIHMDKTKCKPRILVKTSKHTASFPCKLCNGNYTRQFSLLRHILCKHKEFAKCQSCLEEISTGSICAKHKVAESTINSTTRIQTKMKLLLRLALSQILQQLSLKAAEQPRATLLGGLSVSKQNLSVLDAEFLCLALDN